MHFSQNTKYKEAGRRLGASLIYQKDLLSFLETSQIKESDIELDQENEENILGQGKFGKVHRGTYRDPVSSFVVLQFLPLIYRVVRKELNDNLFDFKFLLRIHKTVILRAYRGDYEVETD